MGKLSRWIGVLVVVLAGDLGGCGGSSSSAGVGGSGAVASVVVTPASATTTVGQTQSFAATARDSSGNVLSVSFVWASDASGIATVTSAGVATGVTQGTAHIGATVSGVTGMATLTVNPAVNAANAIPESFFGFTVNKACSIGNVQASGVTCNNPESHSFPGLPFTWARSLGASAIKWSDLVQCDPTGSVCPKPGSGCSKNGLGTGGAACPSTELEAGCVPSAKLPTDPTNCAYQWTTFDFFTKTFNANNVDWLYSLYYTPDYLSVRGSRCTGVGTATFGADATCVSVPDECTGASGSGFLWGCDPPYDIDATPGSGLADGTDQGLINFVTAMSAHMQANAEHITYLEIWNEPTVCSEWDHKDQSGTNCTAFSGGTATGTVAQLVRMAKDARSTIHVSFPAVKVTTPPVVGASSMAAYLEPILAAGAAQFDVVGFHGYYALGDCPANCPVPENFISVWTALTGVTKGLNLSSLPVIDTEFSWSANTDVTNGDMRAAQAARIYLLQEGYFPALQRVDWYGEDFQEDLAANSGNGGNPDGGSGEFWASGSTNVTDGCTTPDAVQGGYDCPAGLAMQEVAKWTVGTTFGGPCTCSASPSGGSCAATIPTGIWSCSIAKTNGYVGLVVWDNTAVTFPCSNAACGVTSYAVPAAYKTDWQDLTGTVHTLTGVTAVTLGAKPILLETVP